MKDFVHELWIVCCVHPKRIADFKAQSPPRQIEFKMARVFFRLGPGQATIDQKFGRKRVCPRISRSRNRSFSMHNNFVAAISGGRKYSSVVCCHRVVQTPNRAAWLSSAFRCQKMNTILVAPML